MGGKRRVGAKDWSGRGSTAEKDWHGNEALIKMCARLAWGWG